MNTTMIVSLIVSFFFSFSVLLNLVLVCVCGLSIWYVRKSIASTQQLELELVEASSKLFISESIEEIINYILELEELLFEVSELQVYSQEPVVQQLSEQVQKTLEGIRNSVVAQEYEKALEDINER